MKDGYLCLKHSKYVGGIFDKFERMNVKNKKRSLTMNINSGEKDNEWMGRGIMKKPKIVPNKQIEIVPLEKDKKGMGML